MSWEKTLEKFGEVDKLEVFPLNGAQAGVLEGLIVGSGWREGLGPIRGVFESKPMGNRCVWSCKWVIDGFPGALPPSQYLPPESMTSKQLFYEGCDVSFRSNDRLSHEVTKLILSYLQHDGKINPLGWVKQMRGALARARELYPEYLCLWQEPDKSKIYTRPIRPGWEKQK